MIPFHQPQNFPKRFVLLKLFAIWEYRKWSLNILPLPLLPSLNACLDFPRYSENSPQIGFPEIPLTYSEKRIRVWPCYAASHGSYIFSYVNSTLIFKMMKSNLFLGWYWLPGENVVQETFCFDELQTCGSHEHWHHCSYTENSSAFPCPVSYSSSSYVLHAWK